jgi:hypothetical protein
MKIINYTELEPLLNKAKVLLRTNDVYDCGISVSFRIYDEIGNTLQLHIFYR